MTPSSTWLEVWIDSASTEYVLVVRHVSASLVEVLDPQDQWKVIETFPSYEAAVHWLNEDEYDLVEGRVLRDDAS